MSISENVGALNNYLARALSVIFIHQLEKLVEEFKKIPVIHDLAKKPKNMSKVL